MRVHFNNLRISESALCFGKCTYPVNRNGVTIGGGTVIPEIKFTLPPMPVETRNLDDVRAQYNEMITGVCQRAVELHQDSIVVEFELLPQMTMDPSLGENIARLIRDHLDECSAKKGLHSLFRITPVDIRDGAKPPLRRRGHELELVLDSFRRCAQAGGDLLSIESTGGKEVTDRAIMEADLPGIIFGAGILGSLDVEFLWTRICEIAKETNTVPAGDTACGIGNTAMVLADTGYVPKVFAAVVRAITAVRSLAAYEAGATGPGKDCGYENIFLKPITGMPMSLEGKSAACAHLSGVGNIAQAYADLWSNESVQNVKLLSAFAPVVSMEQLIYDCRLMNVSLKKKKGRELRDWLVESDASLDPQAYIFRPEIVIRLATALLSGRTDYERSVNIARAAVESIGGAVRSNRLLLPERELPWLDMLEKGVDSLPEGRDEFIDAEVKRWQEEIRPGEYDLLDKKNKR